MTDVQLPTALPTFGPRALRALLEILVASAETPDAEE